MSAELVNAKVGGEGGGLWGRRARRLWTPAFAAATRRMLGAALIALLPAAAHGADPCRDRRLRNRAGGGARHPTEEHGRATAQGDRRPDDRIHPARRCDRSDQGGRGCAETRRRAQHRLSDRLVGDALDPRAGRRRGRDQDALLRHGADQGDRLAARRQASLGVQGPAGRRHHGRRRIRSHEGERHQNHRLHRLHRWLRRGLADRGQGRRPRRAGSTSSTSSASSAPTPASTRRR